MQHSPPNEPDLKRIHFRAVSKNKGYLSDSNGRNVGSFNQHQHRVGEPRFSSDTEQPELSNRQQSSIAKILNDPTLDDQTKFFMLTSLRKAMNPMLIQDRQKRLTDKTESSAEKIISHRKAKIKTKLKPLATNSGHFRVRGLKKSNNLRNNSLDLPKQKPESKQSTSKISLPELPARKRFLPSELAHHESEFNVDPNVNAGFESDHFRNEQSPV